MNNRDAYRISKRKTLMIQPAGIVLLACLAVLVSGATPSYGQDLSASPQRTRSGDLPIHSVLYEACEAVPKVDRMAPTKEQIDRFASRGMTLRDDGRVFVQIVGPEGKEALKALDRAAMEKLGVELGVDATEVLASQPPGAKTIRIPLTAYRNHVEALLPIDRLTEVAESLPKGHVIEAILPPDYDQVVGEGPAVINSDSYLDAGQNGAGLTIGVIDGGFENLSAAQGNGDAPAAYTAINLTGEDFEDDGTHGTGCVEAAFDHAPGAAWRIYKIDSAADTGFVVLDAIDNGVDVLSHSLSRYNLGWSDNTGIACAAANGASDNGILFFTSAGNRAQSHWQGSFTDVDDDGWHEFAPGDETIDITIGSGRDGNYYLSWSNGGSELDFYLLDSSFDEVASSTNIIPGWFEEFYYDHDAADATFHLAVYRFAGPAGTDIEIFSHNAGAWNEHAVAANSTTSPSNATGSRVISVGAVDHNSYGQANGSDVIAGYSSRGPSNSGMTLPDLSGPTNTVGLTYPGGFGGTSSATPNAAGAAGAFWSSNTQLGAFAIQWLLKEQADLWRDWGANGNDNTYGKGGLFLVDYQFGTRWLARSYPGTADLPSAPYYTLQGAHDGVPDNGRILIFGLPYGTYPEPALLGHTGKHIDVEVVEDTEPAIAGH